MGASLFFIIGGIAGIVVSDKFPSRDNKINFGGISFFTLAFALIGLFNFTYRFKTAKDEKNRIENTRDNSLNEPKTELSTILANRAVQVLSYQSVEDTK
ncbi:hypothetical protein [Candidatus Mesenet endosymbiont of Phosphuga atrata]|uniref:hypothetical protein n=1 Tax=Candidatus Mesenet endosymbiont of Phosphuga atrata TaxID=3066221 RepID=UPI0030D3AADB